MKSLMDSIGRAIIVIILAILLANSTFYNLISHTILLGIGFAFLIFWAIIPLIMKDSKQSEETK